VERYRRASGRRQKIEICKEAVEAVRCAGGRFIRYIPPSSTSEASLQPQEAPMPVDTSNAQALASSLSSVQGGRWMDIGNIKAREKASHAIRQEIKKMRKRRASLPTTTTRKFAASSPMPALSSPSSSMGSQSSGLSGFASMQQDGSTMAAQQALWTTPATRIGPLAHTEAQHDSLATRHNESHWDWDDATTLAAMNHDPEEIEADLTNVWGDDTDTPALPGFGSIDTS
jgi:hypothetical protein